MSNLPDSGLCLIKNANVYAPEALGRKHLLTGGGKILYIGDDVPQLDDALDIEVVDFDGAILTPGFVDGHAHVCGGGGEAGFSTRVPPVPLSDFTSAGVTTVIGLLGTDDLTRSTESLVAQVYGLREEGMSAYCYTGGYHLPLTTLTGSVKSDIVFIEPVLGVGELAISDHRSSQPRMEELLRIASETHVAKLMTGKAGVVHLHLGDGERGLELVRDCLRNAEIPARTYNPTHVNRRRALFEEACDLTRQGCSVDVTAFETGDKGFEPVEALSRYIDQGFDQSKLTISSDGGGCLPNFNCQGELLSLGYGRSSEMTEVFTEMASHYPVEAFLPFFSTNVAQLMLLHGKGRIRVGADADLIGFDQQFRVNHVMAMGRWHVFNQELKLKGTFE